MSQPGAVQRHTRRAPPSNSHLLLVQRKCACGGPSGLTAACPDCEKKKLLGKPLQTKLRISEPGDEYEREADWVAAQVMKMTDSEVAAAPLQSSATAQRRGAGSMVQREPATGELPASAGDADKGGSGTTPEESRCPSWRGDPESISKRAAETYARNDMTPPSQARVERINCEPPLPNGNYGCYVHFSDGVVLRVIVRAKDIVVGTGPGPITTETPPAATPLCFYDYTCPEGLLVLTKRECKSAKPAASSGPTLVGQRRATPGTSGAIGATPLVSGVLSSSGTPLDVSTRKFFSARFGHDFANVRVHTDARAAESARSLKALAYTIGHHVVFGSGQYATSTENGKRLLAHELAHVIQQHGMNVLMPGASISPDDTGEVID